MTTIESIKRQIQNMRDGLQYIDCAVSLLAEQERIKHLEAQMKELENIDSAIHRWCAAVKTMPNGSGAK